MRNSPDIVSINDPHRIKHPFLVADPDGYGHCATCKFQPGNERHRKVAKATTFVMVDDAEYSAQWIAVPLTLVLACNDADQMAAAVRAQLSLLRAAA